MFFYLDVVPGSSLAQRVSCLRRWLDQACPMSASVSTRTLLLLAVAVRIPDPFRHPQDSRADRAGPFL